MINSHFNSNNPSYQKRKEKARGSICYLSFSWLEYIKKKKEQKKETEVVLPSTFGWREIEEQIGSRILCEEVWLNHLQN
jgi:hypothetical protein